MFSITLKIAVEAPIPRARVRTATRAKAGAFLKVLSAYRISCASVPYSLTYDGVFRCHKDILKHKLFDAGAPNRLFGPASGGGLKCCRWPQGNEPVCGFLAPMREYLHEKTIDHGGSNIGGRHHIGWECDGTADSRVESFTSTSCSGVTSACYEGTSGCREPLIMRLRRKARRPWC